MKGFVKFLGLIAGLVAIGIVGSLFFESHLTSQIVEVKVLQLVTIEGKYKSLKRLVITQNETFDNNDNYYHQKSNAAEIQSKLKRNRVYRFRVVGYEFRKEIPFLFSKNRNIIEIVE